MWEAPAMTIRARGSHPPRHVAAVSSRDAECPSVALSEAQVRTAVAVANVPALLMVVFQATGDERWLKPPYQPTRGRGLGDHDTGGLPDDVQAEIREAAVEAILG